RGVAVERRDPAGGVLAAGGVAAERTVAGGGLERRSYRGEYERALNTPNKPERRSLRHACTGHNQDDEHQRQWVRVSRHGCYFLTAVFGLGSVRCLSQRRALFICGLQCSAATGRVPTERQNSGTSTFRRVLGG